MRLRSFTAKDMPSAMEEIRRELGEDAIILSSSVSKQGVTVTAAVEPDGPMAVAPKVNMGLGALAEADKEEEWVERLVSLLRYHGVPEALAGRMVYRARSLQLSKLFALQKISPRASKAPIELRALTKLLEDVFRFDPLPMKGAQRWMLIGPPGIGKTLSVSRLAAELAMSRHALTVITTDTKRAGGVEQLSAFTRAVDVPLLVADSPSQLAAALKRLPKDSHVLIDTAGCNPYSNDELEELTMLIAVGGMEPLLAMPAGLDALEAADAVNAFAFPAVKRLLVTRADTARRFGSVLAAAEVRGLSYSNISNSAEATGALPPLSAEVLAQCLLKPFSTVE